MYLGTMTILRQALTPSKKNDQPEMEYLRLALAVFGFSYPNDAHCIVGTATKTPSTAGNPR